MSEPIRVLMVSGEYPPQFGGVGDYTARLCAALRPEAVRVALLTGGATRVLEHCAKVGNPIWVARGVPRWGVGTYRAVLGAAQRLGADVVHVQYQAGAYQLQAAANLLPLWMRLRAPWLRAAVTFHDLRPPYLFPKAGPLRPAMVRLMADMAHGVVCTEPADLAALGTRPGRRWIPLASNIDCAPPPDFEPQAWRRARGLPVDAPLVGFFGFLNASKGVETLLRALAQLPEARLALLGAEAGPSDATDRREAQRLRALAASLGLEGRVWRSGSLPAAELSAALLACDVIALPFVDGASGRRGSLLEALTHGRAVVTTHGPRAGVVTEGQDALLVPPGDSTALADALRNVLQSSELRARLEQGARRLAARFTWPAIARAHEEWYAELARAPRR